MKNFKTVKNLGLFLAFSLVLLSSCKKDENEKMTYDKGVFIANEGGFGHSNGSVSFYSNELDSTFNNIFEAANKRVPGDVVQSISVHNNKAYIVVNNSNKIEVVDHKTFISKAGEETIINVSSPRYFVAKGNMGYVSCWGSNSVKAIDLSTQTVIDSVATSSGPEKMLIKDNKLYVTNSGGLGTDSTLSIIDLTTFEVEKTLSVNYKPVDILTDNAGDIWVLSAGKVIYDADWAIVGETPSMLYKIEANTNEVVEGYSLFADAHPHHLEIDEQGDFFVGGGFGFEGVYKVNFETLELNKIILGYLYGFNIDPYTNTIFGTLAPTYTAAGILKRFNVSGVSLGEYEVGIGPNSATFKRASE